LFQWGNKARVNSEVKRKDDKIGTITEEGRKDATLGNFCLGLLFMSKII
jgi:hypothetical protein